MAEIDEFGRPLPPESGDEVASLLGFLEWQRATFAWKCAGLDAAGLATTLPTSTMTLGGMMKHLALVEEWWFSEVLADAPKSAPWSEVDWDADADWDWHSAADDEPDALRELWTDSVTRSRELVAEALAHGGLGQLGARVREDGGTAPSLRWIVLHMIEEYARHNGHADLLRESVDGATGE